MNAKSTVLDPAAERFRRRLLERELLIGTFVKTPHPAVVEVLGKTLLDCVCVDSEHARFDRGDLDGALLAARANQMAALVRARSASPEELLNALDLGSSGVIVPHVNSADTAALVARTAHHGKEGRRYAGSTRAGGFGSRAMGEVIADANATATVIAQIDHASALAEITDIVSLAGIDAIFIGRIDLTVSLGATSPFDPRVIDAVREICAAALRRGRPVGMFTATVEEARDWAREGVSLFLLQSDQQWLAQGAHDLVFKFRAV